MKKGFTLVELIITIAIIAIIVTIILSTFVLFNKSQALDKDKETIVEVLEQARSQTLSSKNAAQYGVHLTSTSTTLFTGATYSSVDSANIVYKLNTTDTIITISLNGGGSDVIFNRLVGDTADNGTVVLSAPSASTTKTVTIYKTGLVESN